MRSRRSGYTVLVIATLLAMAVIAVLVYSMRGYR